VRFFAGGVDQVVHPGAELWVTATRFEVGETVDRWKDTKVRYELFCDGFVTSGEETIPGTEVMQVLRNAMTEHQRGRAPN